MKRLKILLCLLILTGCTKNESSKNHVVINGLDVNTNLVTDQNSVDTSFNTMENGINEDDKCDGGICNYLISDFDITPCYKPVIYLYPEERIQVNVKMELDGDFIFTYPTYKNGWNVFANSDGIVIDSETGKEYSYLFWEGNLNIDYDLSEGYIVKGDNTVSFLENILPKVGLTPKEYNEFIVYWAPLMEKNKYNLISFQQEEYTKAAELIITPKPDSVLRVFMAYKALDEPIDIEEPTIKPFERNGFTVIEWGGTEIK